MHALPFFRGAWCDALWSRVVVALLPGLLAAECLVASEPPLPADAYHLQAGDQVEVTVFDEPDFATSQRIDASGILRIPLLGDVAVAGCSIREAEQRVADAFVERRLLKQPAVTIAVRDYAVRQAFVFGKVASQGPVRFPPEKEQLDIVEVISLAGGFTSLARTRTVRLTRTGLDGRTTTRVVDVEAMIRGRGDRAVERIWVRPGDVIYVDEIIA